LEEASSPGGRVLRRRTGVRCRLCLGDVAKANKRDRREEDMPHGRIPNFTALESIHAWAARNRVKPGTWAARLTSFHLASNPRSWSWLLRLNRVSTKRATRR